MAKHLATRYDRLPSGIVFLRGNSGNSGNTAWIKALRVPTGFLAVGTVGTNCRAYTCFCTFAGVFTASRSLWVQMGRAPKHQQKARGFAHWCFLQVSHQQREKNPCPPPPAGGAGRLCMGELRAVHARARPWRGLRCPGRTGRAGCGSSSTGPGPAGVACSRMHARRWAAEPHAPTERGRQLDSPGPDTPQSGTPRAG